MLKRIGVILLLCTPAWAQDPQTEILTAVKVFAEPAPGRGVANIFIPAGQIWHVKETRCYRYAGHVPDTVPPLSIPNDPQQSGGMATVVDTAMTHGNTPDTHPLRHLASCGFDTGWGSDSDNAEYTLTGPNWSRVIVSSHGPVGSIDTVIFRGVCEGC